MKYRNVGKSGLKISEITLGSWVTQLTSVTWADPSRTRVHAPKSWSYWLSALRTASSTWRAVSSMT